MFQDDPQARYQQEQNCKALYELSQHPGFEVLIGTIEANLQARAPMPTCTNSRVAFESYSIVRETIEQILQNLNEGVETGRRLASLDDHGEDQNAEEDRHHGRYRRA